MTRVPIACTLSAGEVDDRVGEWREFLAQCVVERRLEGHGGSAPAQSRRRRACSRRGPGPAREGMLRVLLFSIELEAGARWLRVDVPPEASPVLAELVALGPR
ncbi:MAG: hypothetical protein M3N28_06375 [Actinomycetota bacterium]|nr:hypothetical protein [Actinomycetota bacterium]